jgi:hypothetical protein
MARSKLEFSGRGSAFDECRTEHLVGDFSRCLAQRPACMYAYHAGPSGTYCLHRSNRRFERRIVAGSSSTLARHP